MSPEAQLDGFIDRFTPEVAAVARAAVARMAERLPAADRLVYDNYNALAIGFAPSQRASEAIFSIAVFPRRVSLCILQACRCDLRDPEGLLQGGGKLVRFIPLASAATLDEPAVQDLMAQALAAAKVPLHQAAAGCLVIKSVSAKQRPRRPR